MELPPGLKTFHPLPAHRTENYITLQYHSKIHPVPPPQFNKVLRTNNWFRLYQVKKEESQVHDIINKMRGPRKT